jgi:hypothetical protein
MSAYYGTPEGDEVAAELSRIKPQADVEPVDDPDLFCATSMPERDFSYAKAYKEPERRNWTRGTLDVEAAQNSRAWTPNES